MRLAPIALLLVACKSGPAGPLDEHTDEARRRYPNLSALYAGDQGIYRGCGPNSGVCHNANELPDLDSVGSILDNVDRHCNQKRMTADAVDDLCESRGDTLVVGASSFEIAWAIPGDTAGAWKLALRGGAGEIDPGDPLAIVRDDLELWHLGRYATATIDRDDPRVIDLQARTDDGAEHVLMLALATAGVPGEPDAVRAGDPNRDGIFGAELGGRLIKPGDPAHSYLLHRLTDPAAGPLMPRANCCSWSLAAVRALWCWVDGLAVDGHNAMAPIDYDRCRSSPDVDLLYPEPGPGCETAGSCPARVDLDDGARFPALYSNVLATRCSGSTCHDRGPVAGLDLSTEARALTTLRTKIVAGDPDGSVLYQRITPGLCRDGCTPMPLGRDPLPDDERTLIHEWIAAGAPSD